MFCINLESNDPYFNLALEEVLLKNSSKDFLILGVNSTSVVTGKHQVSHKESDTRFLKENNIPLIRRITGGGTVFHDPGNLNFSFIIQSESGKQVDFRKHTLPVIRYLAEHGVEALFEGKNDVKVGGLKISGNAEHVYKNRILHHGTLLFDTALENLRRSLRKDRSHYITRAVESNPSSVMNIKERLLQVKDMDQFRTDFFKWSLNYFPDSEEYTLKETDILEAEKLAERKYRTWEWNYAYGPEYRFKKVIDLEGMEYYVTIFVKDGIIWSCNIEGNQDKMSLIAKDFIGIRHMPDDVLNILTLNGVSVNEGEVFNFF